MNMRQPVRILLTLIVVAPLVAVPRSWTISRHAVGPALAEAQQAQDTRQRLLLPAPARDKVLAEMRVMLESVNRILQALAAGDTEAVEKAARATGMASAADVNPQVKQELPQPFLALGMQTHKGFDTLADRMKARGSQEDAIKGLAELTANCVACHASYRIDEKR